MIRRKGHLPPTFSLRTFSQFGKCFYRPPILFNIVSLKDDDSTSTPSAFVRAGNESVFLVFVETSEFCLSYYALTILNFVCALPLLDFF